jgi:hypothetical protein
MRGSASPTLVCNCISLGWNAAEESLMKPSEDFPMMLSKHNQASVNPSTRKKQTHPGSLLNKSLFNTSQWIPY